MVAAATDYATFIAGLRLAVDELGVTHDVVDDIAGLTRGHTNKMLRPHPGKAIGRQSLGLLLGALGLKLLIAVDPEQRARLARRLVKDRWPPVRRAQHSKLRRALFEAAAKAIANDNSAAVAAGAGLHKAAAEATHSG